MSGSSDSTVPDRPIPSVVLVAPAPGMLDTWLELLQSLEEVPSIQLTDLAGVTTTVARWHPMAILVEQELLDFDEQEFRELARDVSAELIVVDAESGKEAIAAVVLPKLHDALVRWRVRDAAR